MIQLLKSNKRAYWQALFLVISTSWLFAPLLNNVLSERTTLISQYETTYQPFAWIFRIGDILAALLLLGAVTFVEKKYAIFSQKKYKFLLFIGFLMLLDPIIITSCVVAGTRCIETKSINFYLHAIESVALAISIFGLGVADAIKRKSLPSILFSCFQIVYLFFGISGYIGSHQLNTATQLMYQFMVIIWLTWYIVSHLQTINSLTLKYKKSIRHIFAGWAYLNGTFAILISLFHAKLLGVLQGIYFANDTAWLAQHGTIVGITMIYISYHLWRGEQRARQIFLSLLFFEIIKYSVITPNFLLLLLYLITFVLLFVLRPYFARGSVALNWHLRLQEISVVLIGTLGSIGLVLLIIIRNPHYSNIANGTIQHFLGLVNSYSDEPVELLKSSLLAHTFSALFLTFIGFILWSIFRPVSSHQIQREDDIEDAAVLINRYSNYSEDYFKLWPKDKEYFWSENRDGFIAYKKTKRVIFALADPIANSIIEKDLLIKTFITHWSSRGYSICFLPISEESILLYKNAGLNTLKIGSSAIIDVSLFSENTIRNKWFRWQINRASKAGYNYKVSFPPHSNDFINQLSQVSNEWISKPGHREQTFALGYFDSQYIQKSKIHFVTDQSQRIIAFANELPTFNSLNQTTVDLMRFRPEYNNVMPFLLSQIILSCNTSKEFAYFDLGFVPLAKIENRITRIAKTIGARRFSSAGLEQFKNKFEPQWVNNYFAYDGNVSDLALIATSLENVMKK